MVSVTDSDAMTAVMFSKPAIPTLILGKRGGREFSASKVVKYTLVGVGANGLL